MEKTIYVCDECMHEMQNPQVFVRKLNVVVTPNDVDGEESLLDVPYILHFCSSSCIDRYFRRLADDIWTKKYPVVCPYTRDLCDYEGVEGRGSCSACAREQCGTRQVTLQG